MDKIPSTFESFDEVNGGFSKGSLNIIDAPAGGGKGVVMKSMIQNLDEKNYNICYVLTETSIGEEKLSLKGTKNTFIYSWYKDKNLTEQLVDLKQQLKEHEIEILFIEHFTGEGIEVIKSFAKAINMPIVVAVTGTKSENIAKKITDAADVVWTWKDFANDIKEKASVMVKKVRNGVPHNMTVKFDWKNLTAECAV